MEEKEEMLEKNKNEIITEDDVVSETTTEKTGSKLPESYAGRFKGLNIANILSIAGAKPQAFTRGEASYGRKRRNAGEEEEEDVEAKNEEIPDAMADQMTEIENVQALWMEFLQEGRDKRRQKKLLVMMVKIMLKPKMKKFQMLWLISWLKLKMFKHFGWNFFNMEFLL